MSVTGGIEGDGMPSTPLKLSDLIQANIAAALSDATFAANFIRNMGATIKLKGEASNQQIHDMGATPTTGDEYVLTDSGEYGSAGNFVLRTESGWVELSSAPDLTPYALKTMLPRVTSGGGIVITTSVDPTTGQYTYEVSAVGGGGGSGDTKYNISIASGEGHLEVHSSYNQESQTVTFTLNTKDIPVCVAVTELPSSGAIEGGFYFVYE